MIPMMVTEDVDTVGKKRRSNRFAFQGAELLSLPDKFDLIPLWDG